MSTESAIVAECMLALSRAGALVQRNNSGLLVGANGRRVRAAIPGAADIVACYDGWFLAIECKTAKGRETRSQELYEKAVIMAGGVYLVCRDAAEIPDLLAKIDAARP